MDFPNKANNGQSEQREGLPPRRHHRPDQEEEKKDGSSPILAPRKSAIDDSRSILSSSTTESSTALLLDQQIAGQRKMGTQSADRAAKQQAKQQARAAAATQRKLPPPSSMTTASQSDRSVQDAIAKSRGRRNTNGSFAKFQTQRPLPAHFRSSTSGDNIKSESNNATKLQRLEEEVAAKSRGKASVTGTKRTPSVLSSNSNSNSSLGSSFTAVKRMNRMEADIAAKERTRAGRGAGTHRASAKSTNGGAPTNRMNRLEADAAAKAQAKASRTTGTIYGKNKNREDAIARKLAKAGVTQTTPAVVPGAVSSTEAADSVATKSILKKKNGIAASAVSDSKVAKSKIASPAAHVVGGGKLDKLRKKDLPNGGTSGLVDIELTEIMNGEGNKNEDNKGLAVAVAVTEDDNENVFIPSAIEFDPDAKLPMYKNQRFRVYGLLGCTLVIILTACAIGVLAILQREQQMRDMFPPTDSPTCARCSIDFIEQLELQVGSQVLNDPSSPEYMAKEWIIHQDQAQLEAGDKDFVQRFLMAAFYFDTHQQADWLSCNEANYAANETDDCDFLKIHRIEPSLEYDPYPAKRWLSSLHECEWAGVGCDELKQIRMIDLPGQGLLGTFPASFKHLPYIQVVALQLNNFTGTLPDSFGQMKHLIHLELHSNKFTGSIPNSWSNARNLQLLNIAGNPLTGGIPSSIGNFRNIKGIFAYKANLTGTLPPELSNAKSLGFMRFQRNGFRGTIPPEYGDMQLNEIWLQGNSQITGTIPPELGKLSNHLEDLRLSETSIEGTIPEEIYDLSLLQRLQLHEARLTGTISPNITKLENVQEIRLHGNEFSGVLPSGFESLTNLKSLWLDHNKLTGAIPPSICNLKEEHKLEFIQADCLPDPVTEVPLIACDCCNICCNDEECMFSEDMHN